MTVLQYDLVVVGGGLTGLALARSLKDTRLNILLCERGRLQAPEEVISDARAIALSLDSQQYFESLGVWAAMAPYASFIQEVHISSKGQYGFCRVAAKNEQLPSLGAVVPLPAIAKGLSDALSQANVEVKTQTTLTAFEEKNKQVICQLCDESGVKTRVQTRVLIAADGLNSSVRQTLGIEAVGRDYEQSALIVNATIQKPHQFTAYERFTAHGPIAVLPKQHPHQVTVVWITSTEEAESIMAGSLIARRDKLQSTFGFRLGRFEKLAEPVCYPLKLLHAQAQRQCAILLMGNAVHNLHPVAGQGFNLSLRDVRILAELLIRQIHQKADFEVDKLLTDYVALRQTDQSLTVEITDQFVQVFRSRFLPTELFRGVALSVLNQNPRLLSKLNNILMGICAPKVI